MTRSSLPGVYLDNNATTMVAPEVLDAMLPFFTEQFGNPSSVHQFGNQVGRALKKARTRVQQLLGAERDAEIIFTSCGTEADSTAILSAVRSQPQRREIITTQVEHPAVKAVCDQLAGEGWLIHRLPVDRQGRLDLQTYGDLLSERVALVSVMWANNETGTLFPVTTMAQMAHEAGVLFHTDAVQAVGKIPIDLAHCTIDMLSLSGHKLHAPKGIGVLYVRRGTPYQSLLRGGRQERGRRAGTENTAAIVALGAASELASAGIEDEQTRVRALRDRLEQGILEAVPHCFVTGDPVQRLPNTSNIAFAGIEGEAIVLLLSKQGIAVSSGSACSAGAIEPSHVMRAMQLPAEALRGTVRFSLSRYTTRDEIERVIATVPGVITQLRTLSPQWNDTGPAAQIAHG